MIESDTAGEFVNWNPATHMVVTLANAAAPDARQLEARRRDEGAQACQELVGVHVGVADGILRVVGGRAGTRGNLSAAGR